MITGPNRNPLFDRKIVPLFSDLLLHDIGTGDAIRQADAGPSEFRTTGGEAWHSRQGFEGLGEAGLRSMIAFLRSL